LFRSFDIVSSFGFRASNLQGQIFLSERCAFAPLRLCARHLYFGCDFAAAPAVKLRNSIFLAPLGGVNTNSLSVTFGARSQLRITTVNSGSPLTCFEVRMNLSGSGLSPSWIQTCQSTSAARNAR